MIYVLSFIRLHRHLSRISPLTVALLEDPKCCFPLKSFVFKMAFLPARSQGSVLALELKQTQLIFVPPWRIEPQGTLSLTMFALNLKGRLRKVRRWSTCFAFKLLILFQFFKYFNLLFYFQAFK